LPTARNGILCDAAGGFLPKAPGATPRPGSSPLWSNPTGKQP